MLFIFLLFATVLSSPAAELDGWVFHPVNPSNTLLSTTDKGFRGTFVKSNLTLYVSEDQVEAKTFSSSDLRAWINAKYFGKKAALLQEVKLSKGSKHLLIFQLPEDNGLRVVPVYAFLKQGRVLFFSMESTLTTYKKDLKEVQSFMKRLH